MAHESSGSSIEEMTSDSGGSSAGSQAGEALVLEALKLENPHQGTGSDVAEIGTSDGNASDTSVSSVLPLKTLFGVRY